MADPPLSPHFGAGRVTHAANWVWSGSLWVPQLGSAGGAITVSASPVVPITSSSAEASHIFKASAGTLYSASVVIGATAGWLMIFDAATDPADGAVTPLRAWPVGSDSVSGTFDANFPTPIAFSSGCVLVFSTTGPLTKTESATAIFSAQVQ